MRMAEQSPDPTVEVVAYDASWASQFHAERLRLLTHVPRVHRVEHIGSTAVPGMAAKPTIDVLMVVADDDLPGTVPLVTELGYVHVPASFADDPQHLFFHRLRGGKRTHHLHVVAASSPLVARYLLVRDYLRAHPEEARRYAEFKRRLAAVYAGERDRYVAAKPEFVDAMIERALRWRRA